MQAAGLGDLRTIIDNHRSRDISIKHKSFNAFLLFRFSLEKEAIFP